MRFDEIEREMRIYESAHDHHVLPHLFIVVRLDGRNFTRLTKETHDFEAPFDERVRDLMIDTTKHLLESGPRVLFAYTQSDEISLLLHRDEDIFNRKLRKFNSIMAGEASAKFSLLLEDMASFDCRVSQLPTEETVIDYFRWRQEDAHRNALNAHCYWMLRKENHAPNAAHDIMKGMNESDKNELLMANGINYNNVPAWQKRGVGLYWHNYEVAGKNPITDEDTVTTRREIVVNMNIPRGDIYEQFLIKRLQET